MNCWIRGTRLLARPFQLSLAEFSYTELPSGVDNNRHLLLPTVIQQYGRSISSFYKRTLLFLVDVA